jgi:hypothetical protein
LEDKGISGRIIFILDLKVKELDGTDWIHLAQKRIQLGNLMNTVMKFQIPLKADNFCKRDQIINF